MFCKCNQRVRWREKSLCRPMTVKKYSQSSNDWRERMQAMGRFPHFSRLAKGFFNHNSVQTQPPGMRGPEPRLGTQSRYLSEDGSVKALPIVAGGRAAKNFRPRNAAGQGDRPEATRARCHNNWRGRTGSRSTPEHIAVIIQRRNLSLGIELEVFPIDFVSTSFDFNRDDFVPDSQDRKQQYDLV